MKITSTSEMTQTELKEEEERLERIFNDGNATVAHANRLAKVRAALRRITSVDAGKNWDRNER